MWTDSYSFLEAIPIKDINKIYESLKGEREGMEMVRVAGQDEGRGEERERMEEKKEEEADDNDDKKEGKKRKDKENSLEIYPMGNLANSLCNPKLGC